MQHEIEVSETEHQTMYARILAKGRVEGRVEGERRGRNSLLRMDEQLGLAMSELREIASVDELEARVLATIRATR